MGIRSLLVLIGVGLAGLVVPVPHPLRVACGSLVALYLPGLAVMLLVGDRRGPAADDVLLPPLYSATALPLLVLAAHPFTHSLRPAVNTALLAALALLLVALVVRRRSLALPDREPLPAAALLVPLAFAGIVGGLHLLNPHLIVRSDTLLHAPIVGEILDRGIPPMDPLLPGAPIQYMWFYHLGVAALVQLTGLSVLNALALMNVVTTLLFPYLIARIAARFTPSPGRIVGASALAAVGVGAAAWIAWPVCLLKTLHGEIRGAAAWQEILAGIHLDDTRVIAFLRPVWTELVNTPDRFLTLSVFQYGIDLVLLVLLILLGREAQKRAPLATGAGLTFLMIGAFLSHVVAGPVAVAAALGTGGLLLLGGWLKLWEPPPAFLAWVVPGTAVLAAAVCWPYFRALTGEQQQSLHLTRYLYLGVTNVFTLAASLIGFAFAWRPLRRRLTDTGTLEQRVLLAWLVVLLLLNLFVTTPNQQSRKFALLFLTLFAVPLALALADALAAMSRPRRGLAGAWLLFLLGVPTALTLRGFYLERPGTLALRNAYRPAGDCATLYRWIASTTPGTAVVTEPNPETLTALHAHRHALVPHPGLQWLSEGQAMPGNVTLHHELFSADSLPPAALRRALALGRELDVVLWADDPPLLHARFAAWAPLFRRVYGNPAGEVYRFDPQAARARL